MTSTIPACKDCKHFQPSRDEMFSTCARSYYETVDYLNGKVTRHDALAFACRKKEEICGRDGKNFEQREVPVEVPRVSARTQLKNLINSVWKYFSRYDMELL